jgi:hypothetical protein
MPGDNNLIISAFILSQSAFERAAARLKIQYKSEISNHVVSFDRRHRV